MSLDFFVISDLHFYNAEALGPTEERDQVALNESGLIIDAAFAQMAAQKEAEIVLIAGDLCVNGRREHHEGMLAKLRRLQQQGKRVYVITSLHDYGPSPIHSQDEERQPGIVCREDLRGLYNDFGFREALASFEALSYVVQLTPGLRLLCLNDDGDSHSYFGFVPGQLDWILEQIRQAKAQGQEIIAMTHHALIPPSPVYPLIAPREMLHDYEATTTALADAGLCLIFTGHTHMQDIRSVCTEKGSTLWQVSTGALTGYDTPLRRVRLAEGMLHVETQRVESELQGKTLSDVTRELFDRLLGDLFYGAAHDIDFLAGCAGNFSATPEMIYKYRVPIRLAGKFLDRLTVGQTCWLCLCPWKAAKSVRRVKVKDLAMEIVRNIYSGNEHYAPGTPMGRAILAVMARLGLFLNPLLRRAGIPPLREFMLSLIYDPTPDNDAALPLWRGC